MKINFNRELRNLDGSEVLMPDNSVAVLSKLLAGWIMGTATTNASDIMKYYNWANVLYQTGSIDLDDAGRKEFKTFVENVQNVSVLAKGYILEILNHVDSN